MFRFIFFVIKTSLSFLQRREKDIIIENILLRKENEVLKRNRKECIRFKFSDRLFYATFLNLTGKAKEYITLVKPETVLRWKRYLIKSFWTFPGYKSSGRPETPAKIKNLILDMKNQNLMWGYKRIQGELFKLGIELDSKTIKNILKDFRNRGKIKQGLTWSQFLKSHIKSMYGMDFFTVDTVVNTRFYVLFIIYHKTREIMQIAITANPVKEFVRQQIIGFSEQLSEVVYMVHDNAGQFLFGLSGYGIKGIRTSVEAPDMNAIAERFVRSVRREMLDYFIIFSERQLRNILKEYINYYNTRRPHQGIGQQIPQGYEIQQEGRIRSMPVLYGLNHNYYREAA